MEPRTRPGSRRPEPLTLVLLATLAGALWAFLWLAAAVRGEETHALDEALLLALRNPADPSDPLGPRWFEEMARDLTALGGTTLLALVTAVVVAGLLTLRQRRAALVVLVAIGGGEILSLALKSGFDRPRPSLVPHATAVYTASFPSGHSMLSAVAWLTLGALVARAVPRRRTKLVVLGAAVLFTLLAGASRVYLGVHWPTDVAAGWAIGAGWAIACWLAARALARRSPAAAYAPAQVVVEIGTPDLDRAARFYAEALGLSEAGRSAGAVDLAGATVPLRLVHGAPPGAHLDVLVEDLDAAVERARAAGAAVEREPADGPRGRAARLTDPFGGRLCLVAVQAEGRAATA